MFVVFVVSSFVFDNVINNKVKCMVVWSGYAHLYTIYYTILVMYLL